MFSVYRAQYDYDNIGIKSLEKKKKRKKKFKGYIQRIQRLHTKDSKITYKGSKTTYKGFKDYIQRIQRLHTKDSKTTYEGFKDNKQTCWFAQGSSFSLKDDFSRAACARQD